MKNKLTSKERETLVRVIRRTPAMDVLTRPERKGIAALWIRLAEGLVLKPAGNGLEDLIVEVVSTIPFAHVDTTAEVEAFRKVGAIMREAREAK